MSMARYVITDAAGAVVNVTEWDGVTEWAPDEGLTAVQSDDAQIGWVYDGETFTPPVVEEPEPQPPGPDKISRLDFRRLLKPVEAARFRVFEAAPALTAEEVEQAFDPESTTPELQIAVAVADCVSQWHTLDEGVIEMDHSDTAEFLFVMGQAGMFGTEAATRVPQILAKAPPT
jgi:hypothetical protein